MSQTDVSMHSAAHNAPLGLRERVIRDAGDARIAEIRTVRSALQPNVLQVIVIDSDGVTGVGETFYGAGVVEAQMHEVDAPLLAIEKPLAVPQEVSRVLQGYIGYAGSGAEVRSRSAIDIALWDIAAKRAGLPLRQLLRSESASALPVYNTCSGAMYVNQQSRQSTDNWGISKEAAPDTPYEDLWGFLNRPGELAQELLEAGYRGMKVWPFDIAAEKVRGAVEIDLSFGLSVLERIRSAVGNQMDLYLEVHSLLNLDAALKLSEAVREFELTWIEDPIRADRTADLAVLRASSSAPVAVGENMGSGANGYGALIQAQAVDTVIVDLGWCGGITDALPLIPATEQAGMSIAYHDCTGPVSLAVAGELSLASPNARVQEVARAFWHTWYPQMASGIPEITAGQLVCGSRPGHGVELLPEFLSSASTTVRSIAVGNG